MEYNDNMFTITEAEEKEVKEHVNKVMSTFPGSISEHQVTDTMIELTGMYILTVCEDYIYNLPPGTAGQVIANGLTFVIIKLEKDLLISPL